MMRKHSWKWAAGLTAAAAVLAGCGMAWGRGDAKDYRSLTHVEYPESIGNDDWEARIALREENPLSEEFLQAVNDFSCASAARILKEKETGENSNYSPVSLYYALALAAQGAEGDTEKEFLKVLGMEDKETLAEECGRFFRRIYLDNEVSRLKLADSLWLKEGEKFRDGFLQTAQDDFYASLFQADFTNPKTGEAMGQWISDQTNGTLMPEFEPNEDEMLAIINTVYLYDEWKECFSEEENTERLFTLSSKAQVTCEYMNRKFAFSPYYEGRGYKGTALRLKNTGSMVLILPEEGVDVQNLLTEETLKDIFENRERESVTAQVSLPKFRFGDSMELTDLLKGMGLENAFDAVQADFSAMSHEQIYVSRVKQETHIGIDEKGAEASAYTALEMEVRAAETEPRVCELDYCRPFLFGIVSDTGVPLFLGICSEPEKVPGGEAVSGTDGTKAGLPERETGCEAVAFSVSGQAGPGGGAFEMAYAGNQRDEVWYYDEFFTLERYEDGVWEEMPMQGGLCGVTSHMEIPKAGPEKLDLDWGYLYGPLEPGVYCVTKEVFPQGEGGPDTDAGVPVHAVFAIREGLGLHLKAEDVSSTGLTLEFVREGGSPAGELECGSSFWLQRLEDGRWCAVERVDSEQEIGWTDEAYPIPEEGSRQNVDWEQLYGELPPGQYRIFKDVTDFRETGDCDGFFFFAEFEIP